MATNNGPDDGIGALTTLTVAVLLSGATFVLMNGRTGRCAGARRSVRLQFQQQQQARQAAIAAAAQNSAPASNATPQTEAAPIPPAAE